MIAMLVIIFMIFYDLTQGQGFYGNDKSHSKTTTHRSISMEKKRQIVIKFLKMKRDQIMHDCSNPPLSRGEIDQKIAQRLGLHLRTIYRWKSWYQKARKGGTHKKMYTEAEKRAIVNTFFKMKDQLIRQKVKLSKSDIEKKIAKTLGVHRSTIYGWKKPIKDLQEVTRKKIYSVEQKQKFVDTFFKIKKLAAKRFSNLIKQKQIDKIIAQKLGVHETTIYQWKSNLQSNKAKTQSKKRKFKKKKYNREEKDKIIKAFYEIKNILATQSNQQPLSMKEIERKIAKKFGIDRRTIYKWKKAKKLNVKIDQCQEEILWKWNFCTKKRTEREEIFESSSESDDKNNFDDSPSDQKNNHQYDDSMITDQNLENSM